MTNRMRRFLHWLATAALSFGTVYSLCWYAEYSFSRPKPISGPNKWGYNVTIIAMDGDKPVELIHQWSGEVYRTLRALNTTPATPAIRAKVQTNMDQPIVWASTGRAKNQFRYYLTSTDLAKANSLLDSKPGEYPQDIIVKVLKDDPANHRQTLQVVVSGDDTDLINVYQVADNRVTPIKWGMFRGRMMAPVVLLLIPVFVVSWMIWKRVLRRVFLPAL